VRGCTNEQSSTASGPWVSARGLMKRRKALSGFRPTCPHRQADAGSFGSQVNVRLTIREERVTASASDDTEIVRACLRVTKRVSEIDTTR